MSSEHDIVFIVNGKQVSIPYRPGWTLLRALREILGLTGAKQSCDNEGLYGHHQWHRTAFLSHPVGVCIWMPDRDHRRTCSEW